MDRTIFHIDVNSAYLSWEAVDRLSKGSDIDLRDIPSVVGGDASKRKGIVLAKSIKTKPFNIITGESLYTAQQKCKNLTIVPPRYNVYLRASNALISFLNEYTDLVEQYSIDEVFMDVSNLLEAYENPIDLADEIRERIYEEMGFTVCVGVGDNKFLAKTATDFRKPNFTNTLFKDEIEEKLWTMPIEKLFMVGMRTATKLKRYGIKTIGDLANKDGEFMEDILKSHGLLVWQYANGIDSSDVDKGTPMAKGMGNSTTISKDIFDIEKANMILLALCEKLGMRLRDKAYLGQVVSVSLRFSDFSKASKQRRTNIPIDSTSIIYDYGKTLLEEIWTGKPIRQIGIRVGDIVTDKISQITLFDVNDYEKQSKIDKTIDNIREKYGDNSVQRACFVGSDIKPIQGGVDVEDYVFMRSHL